MNPVAGLSTVGSKYTRFNCWHLADFFKDLFAEFPTTDTPLLAQAQNSPDTPSDTSSDGETSGDAPDQNIENTPSENAAGDRADPGRRSRHHTIPGLFGEGAQERNGYLNSKCPNGAKWACCIILRGTHTWSCRWLTDNSICRIRACCFPNSRGRPDEYCPDSPPMRKVMNALDKLGGMIPSILGPAGGGAVGGSGTAGGGAAGAGAGVWELLPWKP